MKGETFREVAIEYRGPLVEAFRVTNPEDAARFVSEKIGNATREYFVALFLDGRHQVGGWHVISMGTATASLVHPRESFRAAVACGACAIILAHNHPSGVTTPSSEDKEITNRLAKAGKILGISVLDSIIVAGEKFASLRDTGDLQIR